MNITIKKALANYYEDLRHNKAGYDLKTWDLETINHHTSGTPCFESGAEMDAYMEALKSLMEALNSLITEDEA